jgi:hypothetical protein
MTATRLLSLFFLLCAFSAWGQSKFSPSWMVGLSANVIDRGSEPDYRAPSFNPRLAIGVHRKWAIGAGAFLNLQNVDGFDRLTTHMTGGFVQWSPIVRNRLRTSAELGVYWGNTYRTTEFPANGPEKKNGRQWTNARLAAEIKIIGPLYLEPAFNFLYTGNSDFDNMPTLGLLVRW